MGCKKGQLSWFIIVGLLFLVLFGVLLIILFSNKPGSLVDNKDRQSLDVYILDCLEESAELGIYSLGMHTGNIAAPTRHLVNNSAVAEHDLEHAKSELIWFMDRSLGQCLQMYPNQDKLDITKKNPIIEVMFTESKTLINMDNMYQYSKGESVIHSQPIEIALDVRYRFVHQTVDVLISERVADTYIYDSPALQTEGFDISVAQYNSTTELWVISDHISNVYAGPFLYAYFVNLI